MYKPGQLITKRVHGANRVFRIAKRNVGDSACDKCVVPILRAKLWSSGDPHICYWCANTLGPNLYLKNP